MAAPWWHRGGTAAGMWRPGEKLDKAHLQAKKFEIEDYSRGIFGKSRGKLQAKIVEGMLSSCMVVVNAAVCNMMYCLTCYDFYLMSLLKRI